MKVKPIKIKRTQTYKYCVCVHWTDNAHIDRIASFACVNSLGRAERMVGFLKKKFKFTKYQFDILAMREFN